MNRIYEKFFLPNTPPLLANNRVFLTSEIMGTGLLVAEAFLKHKDNYVVVTNNIYNAQKMLSLLSTLVDPKDLLFYPCDDMLFSEVLTATKELEAQRLFTMFQSLDKEKKYIYVTNLSSLIRPTIKPQYFQKNIEELKLGMKRGMMQFVTHLMNMGYQRVNHVEATMQFASRGDIVDFYPVNEQLPIRIEFFDDVIESMRYFDVATQMSVSPVAKTYFMPASEYSINEQDKTDFVKAVWEAYYQAQTSIKFDEIKPHYIEVEERINDYFAGKDEVLAKYLLVSPLYKYSLLDYILEPKVVLANEPQLLVTNELLLAQAERFVQQESRKQKLLPNTQLFQSMERLYEGNYFKTTNFSEDNLEHDFRFRMVENIRSKDDFSIVVNKYLNQGYSVFFAINNLVQLEQVKALLGNVDFPYSLEEENQDTPIIISSSYYPEGFVKEKEKIVLFTSKELFNITRNEMRYNTAFKSGTVIRNYDQLKPGDYVVHEHHGIGQYLQIESIVAFGATKDYIKIKYAGDETLDIPLEQIQLLRKYGGREGSAPKLNKIGSQEWSKTKARIKEKIDDIADNLLRLQAVRASNPGFAFPPDDEFQKEFELGFPYELTGDQDNALIEIKKDMEEPHVMDRLLSGDVGFGKTEVALRVAFKAIAAGKQVLFLCPTTLLARQHYEVAADRFASFGVKVGMISRLVTPKAKENIVQKFQNGEIHLLIGTHALFSVDYENTNIGLLIVDEEQRFGVEQKEIIKKMKTKVDVLTLSATPIPRTLQMSLLGVRGLSQINTPPQERMPIQTYVIKRDDYIVKELIERELSRGGQVFYLYNRISHIYQMASKLSNLVPEAKIGVIHGQMDRNEIEDIMSNFYNNEINVLVATSIIENGIDVPNANVIIIENADHFGLSQLYQIKGRVGRGNRIAYAYLLYQGQKIMNDDAKKRLEAIQEFTALGSGHKIAERDLMIRGAGDILGAEQSGFVDSVGIDMYLKMLQDTMNNKKYNLESEPLEQSINITGVEAYIPSIFATNADKFNLYLEIKQSKKLTTVKELELKVKDMYGFIPEPLQMLFLKRQVELMVNSKVRYVEEVIDEATYLDIVPGPAFLNIKGSMVRLDEKIGHIFRNIRFITTGGKIKIRIIKEGEWFPTYSTIVRTIVGLVRETIN